jgi:hypothetical protein
MDTLPPPSLPPGGDYKAVLDPSLACMAEQEHRERSEAAAAEPAGPSATEPIQVGWFSSCYARPDAIMLIVSH